uniref:Uncharacterized protein n=1 Tax=Amphimedon queenslandica TaxID=400682 RepID=A0A1X7VJJ7_AMPQE
MTCQAKLIFKWNTMSLVVQKKIAKRDLITMYLTYEPGSKINLWTERKSDTFGPCVDFDDETDIAPKAKKGRLEHLMKCVMSLYLKNVTLYFSNLKKNILKWSHQSYVYGAKLIESGRHESY